MPDAMALAAGLLAGAIAVLGARVLRHASDAWALLAVVAAVAMVTMDMAPVAVLVGVALLVFSKEMAWVVRVPVALLAVVLLAAAGRNGQPWGLQLAVFVVAWVLLVGVRRSRAAVPPRVLCTLLATTAAAIYVAVPDTEQVTVVAVALGLVAAAALLGIVELGPPDRSGVGAVVALLVWSAGVGAGGRPASFAGATAAFGFVFAFGGWRRRGTRLPVPVVLGAHAVVAMVVARTLGLAHRWLPATVGALLVVGSLAFVGRATRGRRTPAAP